MSRGWFWVGLGDPGWVIDRHDLTDDEWAALEGFLPDATPRRGGQWKDHRQVVNGVLWRTRTGAPWRDLPYQYGNWKTVYNRHRLWSMDGTWARALDGVRAGADGDAEWVVGSDPTVIRAHHDAAGARHKPASDIAVDPKVAVPEHHTGGSIELQEFC